MRSGGRRDGLGWSCIGFGDDGRGEIPSPAGRSIDVSETEVQAVTSRTPASCRTSRTWRRPRAGCSSSPPMERRRSSTASTSIMLEEEDTWGELERNYASVTTSYDESNLWNQVVVTAEDLTDQTSDDEPSQSTVRRAVARAADADGVDAAHDRGGDGRRGRTSCWRSTPTRSSASRRWRSTTAAGTTITGRGSSSTISTPGSWYAAGRSGT